MGDAALLANPTDEKEIAIAIKSLHDNSVVREKLMSRGTAPPANGLQKILLKVFFHFWMISNRSDVVGIGKTSKAVFSRNCYHP